MATMDSCRQAIARVRSLMSPPNSFVSGTVVYESADPKKQAITDLASSTAAAFECGRLRSPEELAILRQAIRDHRAHLDLQAHDAELEDYLALLSAVEDLVAACANQ